MHSSPPLRKNISFLSYASNWLFAVCHSQATTFSSPALPFLPRWFQRNDQRITCLYGMQETNSFRPQFIRIIPTDRKDGFTEYPVTSRSNYKWAAAVPIALPQCFLAISINHGRALFNTLREQTFSIYRSQGNFFTSYLPNLLVPISKQDF